MNYGSIHVFLYACLIVPVPFIEKTAFSALICLCIFVKISCPSVYQFLSAPQERQEGVDFPVLLGSEPSPSCVPTRVARVWQVPVRDTFRLTGFLVSLFTSCLV